MNYPKEIAANVEKQTFYIEDRLGYPTSVKKAEEAEQNREWNKQHPNEIRKPTKANAPLMVFEPTAGFKLTIINEERKAADATISVEDMSNIIAQSKVLYEEETRKKLYHSADTEMDQILRLLKEMGKKEEAVRFSHGQFAGKRPEDVLSGEYDHEAMKAYWKELKDGIAEHPEYKQELEAIRDACRKEEKIPDEEMAYNTRLTMGSKFRGLTPAEFLQKNPDSRGAFVQQMNYIKGLAEKPGAYQESNRKQLRAMTAALKLFDAGRLTGAKPQEKSSSTAAYVLYESPVKVNPYPGGTRADGKHHCSRVKISWKQGDPRQVCVEIQTFYAHMKKNAQGLFQYLPDTKDDDIINRNYLTADWWNFHVVQIIGADIQSFLMSNFPTCRREAYAAEARNIEASRKANGAA